MFAFKRTMNHVVLYQSSILHICRSLTNTRLQLCITFVILHYCLASIWRLIPLSHQVSYVLGSCLRYISRTTRAKRSQFQIDFNQIGVLPRACYALLADNNVVITENGWWLADLTPDWFPLIGCANIYHEIHETCSSVRFDQLKNHFLISAGNGLYQMWFSTFYALIIFFLP